MIFRAARRQKAAPTERAQKKRSPGSKTMKRRAREGDVQMIQVHIITAKVKKKAVGNPNLRGREAART